jgi:hypothetical protein
MQRHYLIERMAGMVLGSVIAAASAQAAVMTDIIAAQPTKNGNVSFTITDTNAGLSVDVVAPILATDTPAQKATKIDAAATAAIAAKGQPESDLFSSAVAGNTVTITKQGGGGMAVNITADGTGEGNNLKTKDSGGNGNNWFWRFIRWLVASADPVVPDGSAFALATTNGLSASATGDGVKLASELQSEISDQLVAEGVVFTGGTDPLTGQPFLASQFFPVGALFPTAGVGLDTNPGYADFLGGIGVELVQVLEPATISLFALGLAGLGAMRRRRTS